MYKAIGFDMGGVIIAFSIPHQIDVISHELRVPYDQVEAAYRELRPKLDVAAMTNQEFWAELLRRVGSQADAASTEHIWSDNYVRDNPFIDGMLALVARLKANGYKVGLLSNIDQEHADLNRDRHIYDRFDVALLSDELHARKPDGEAFQDLAAALEVQPAELVFIDDLAENVAGAEQFGATGILFRGYSDLIRQLDSLGINAK